MIEREEARYLTNEDGERVGVVLGVEEYERLRRDAEEAVRMRRHPGVAFAGDGGRRRAWVLGTAFDVWQIVAGHQDIGRERVLEESSLSGRHLETALAYYKEYPEEVDAMIDENKRPLEYWREKYPNLDIEVIEY